MIVTFKVGDRITVMKGKRAGKIIRVWGDKLTAAPANDEITRYDIVLDNGQLLSGQYRGIKREKK